MSYDQANSSEETPLLQPSANGDTRAPPRSPQLTVYVVVGMIFYAALGSVLVQVPIVRILEDNVCRTALLRTAGPSTELLALGQVDESLCKGDDIQSEVATLTGIEAMLEALPSIILAFPYGLLADKIGRRPVLLLAFLGSVLAQTWLIAVLWFWQVFPARLIWTSTIFLVVGGGNSVIINMIYTILTDLTSIEERANVFFLNYACSMTATLIGSIISARLMMIGPWLPLLLGHGIVLSSLLLAVFIPETLPSKAFDTQTTDDEPSEIHVAKLSMKDTLQLVVRHVCDETEELAKILKSSTMMILSSTFLLHGFLIGSPLFFVQYISKRFGWTLATSGLIASGRQVVSITLLLGILPALSRWLTSSQFRFGWSIARKDLTLARISIVLQALGAILLAAPSAWMVILGMVIFVLGSGFIGCCRSLITILIDGEHTGRLYALLSVLDATGMLAAGPMMAGLFSLGMKMGDYWLGLPYIAISTLCCLGAAAVLWVRVDADESDSENNGV